jgi:hypothetical protein
MPAWLQSTVFETLPPDAPANFAVPGCTLADALTFCRVIKKGLKPPFEPSRGFPIRLCSLEGIG